MYNNAITSIGSHIHPTGHNADIKLCSMLYSRIAVILVHPLMILKHHTTILVLGTFGTL